jgi:hypothetical protein
MIAVRRLAPPRLAAAAFRRSLIQALARRQLGVAGTLASIRQRSPGCFRFALDDSLGDETAVGLAFARGTCAISFSPGLGGERLRYVADRLIPLLGLLADCRGDAAGAVALNLEDYGLVPGLAFSDWRPDRPLIPDPVFFAHSGYRKTAQHYLADDIAWGHRRKVAFWRGSTTGMGYQPGEWRALDRVRLCAIAADRPDLFDIGLAGLVQVSEADTVEIATSGLVRNFVPETEFHRYAYQVDIDGNSNSWPGLFQKLLTGSPVLKVSSRRGFRQWYYDRLVPWENFVPVETDMADLIEKVEWLKGHDAEAQRIGAAGRTLAMDMTLRTERERAQKTIVAALR